MKFLREWYNARNCFFDQYWRGSILWTILLMIWYLMTDGSWEFSAEKKRVKDRLVFSPGEQTFKGKKGEEGDRSKYEVAYTDATEEAGPLRIIVQGRDGFFQVGPSAKKEYKTFFYSAIDDEAKERGFCLTAEGAPEKADHWVRFTEFKVVKR